MPTTLDAPRIRRAVPDDADTLAALRWQFRAELGEATEPRDAFQARCAAAMRAELSPGGRWTAWVAERDGALVGNAWLQVIAKLPSPSSEAEAHGYISNVFVVPAARGAGIGRALVDAALAFCDGVPVHDVILWPSERSRSLYRRAGFGSTEDILSRRAAGGPDA
ncbi:MAG: GNAT family N-acetyltransferase [Gemmatimonadota bacterium]|nr:GNAT family N-acetyltransferase [Gemmatimonadota bacterium]